MQQQQNSTGIHNNCKAMHSVYLQNGDLYKSILYIDEIVVCRPIWRSLSPSAVLQLLWSILHLQLCVYCHQEIKYPKIGVGKYPRLRWWQR